MFDKDGNGTISADEIKEVLGSESTISTKAINGIIKEVDENGQLKFFASAIVNMILTVDFINSIVTSVEKTKELNSK